MMRLSSSWGFLRTGRLLPLLFLAVLGGCIPEPQPITARLAEVKRSSDHPTRLSCFLVLKDAEGPAIRLEVTAIEVLADDLWLQIAGGPLELDSAAIGAGQVFLGGRAVPPGLYQRLRLTVTKGSARQVDGSYAIIAPEPIRVEVTLPVPLKLEGEDSRSLLITWDVQNSLEPGNVLRPVLEVEPPVRQLLVDLVFAACPDIDTIFVVRADKNWVVESFGLKGRPTYMAIDPDPSRQRLFVLAVGDRAVKVVDLTSQRALDVFPVPLSDAPAFMTSSPDGQAAYLLDAHSGYLSRMELTTGRSTARVRLGFRPEYATFLEGQNLLAVSLSLSQTVLLLDPLSLATVGTIPAGSIPQGLAAVGNQLFIAESGDHTVSIADLPSRRNVSRLAVGFGPRRLLATESLVYVSNSDSGSLSVLMPGQLGVIQEIQGLGRPLEMAFDLAYRRLYVADEEAAALAVIDSNSNLLLGQIALGAKPADLAVTQ